METKAYLLVFDGLADWETGLAMCEINKKEDIQVVTVGFSDRTVTTMGGLKITPDATLKDVDPDSARIFIAPGGDMWEQESNEELTPLLEQLAARRVHLGAICGATLAFARAGLLNQTYHTSNSLQYLKDLIPGYEGEQHYVNQLAVADKNIITASGAGSVEFAHEVIKQLRLYDEQDTRVWFDIFKNGIMPE